MYFLKHICHIKNLQTKFLSCIHYSRYQTVFSVSLFISKEYLDQWKPGETARLFVKCKHAYGSKGCEQLGIPPDVDLTFIVTMKNFIRVSHRQCLTAIIELESYNSGVFTLMEMVRSLPYFSQCWTLSPDSPQCPSFIMMRCIITCSHGCLTIKLARGHTNFKVA